MSFSVAHQYDNQGNILKHTITDKNQKSVKQGIYDIDDRTELFDNTNYVYDLDGQLISKINGEGITSYSYTSFGDLKEAILPDNTKITYLYNVNNQRSAKLINGRVVEKYLWLNKTTLLSV
jgi:YD repeat-containing protein